MKALARSYVWWPRLDHDIEQRVKSCVTCQTNRPSPPEVPLHPWEWPTKPWVRIHVDHAGPFLGHMYFIVVDVHSKWLEVKRVSSVSSAVTITQLKALFATFGLPEQLVSDNGPAFTSSEFASFMNHNGIRHMTSAPFHPSSNGLAERAVQSFKEGVKKLDGGNIEDKIVRFLFSYRRAPHSTTGRSPAELSMGRQPRSRLDLLKPNLATRIQDRQEQMKSSHDRGTKERSFADGDLVFVHNYGSGAKWLPGQVTKHTGPVSCRVMMDNGLTWRRHYDQLRTRYRPGLDSQLAYREHLQQAPDVQYGPPKALASTVPIAPSFESAGPMQTAVSPSAPETGQPNHPSTNQESSVGLGSPVELRRSSRVIKAPVRLDL